MELATTMRSWRGLAELRPYLTRHLRRYCRDHNDIEDLVQESLLRAARYRESLADPRCLRAWVRRISWRVFCDRLQREARLPRAERGFEAFDELEGREHTPGTEGERRTVRVGPRTVEEAEALRHLEGALRRLKEEDRGVLAAHYAGREREETARLLDVRPDMVKVRLFRARERLRREIARDVERERAELEEAVA